MANKGTADFLLFVPDNATAKVLERLMPPSPLDNVKLHVVGGGGGLGAILPELPWSNSGGCQV